MSTTAIRRRALVAVAGATAGLAAVLAASPADAAPAMQPLADGQPEATTRLAGTPAIPTSDDSSVEASDTQQVTDETGALVTCYRRARISGNTANNTYKVGGALSCSAAGYLGMRCKPVHRHSLYWHSHAWAFDITTYNSSLDRWSGSIAGTNGDTYKAHCEYWFNGYYLGSLESPAITL